MNQQELQLAMSLIGYTINIDYSMVEDYNSIIMLSENPVPSEQFLQQALDNEVFRLQREALDLRIQALGDIPILIDSYFQQNQELMGSNSSWNPAGFNVDNINSSFGWDFENLSKPNIDELEAIKASLEE